MPVPKSKEKKYGKIVGHMINEGKSLDEAKNIADRAIVSRKGSASSKSAHKKVKAGAAF